MKLILITGNHPRHFYLANELSSSFKNIIWIIEKRESFIPKPKKNMSNKLKKLSKIHFTKRKNSETKFFGNTKFYKFTNLRRKVIIERKNFKRKIAFYLQNEKADVLITFGCGKIPTKIFKNNKIKNFWNIHGGLSPWFKGSITNFWPSYLLMPQYTGITLHKLSSKIDGGDILLQTSCKLNINDGLHDLNCRIILNFCKIFKKKLKKISLKKNIKGTKQKFEGKIWKKADWSEKHLIIIYEKFKDKIIKFCVKNNLIKIKPKLLENI